MADVREAGANAGIMFEGDARPGAPIGAQTERRIAWLTLAIGSAAAAAFLLAGRNAWGVGVALGAVLAWFNFRWLARGLDALVAASTAQEGRPKPQVPLGTYFTALFRYALLGLSVYVIFIYLHVPLGSMLVGLCALGAAAIAASLYEILRPAA
jgi:small-conductance mechanosensitive channel